MSVVEMIAIGSLAADSISVMDDGRLPRLRFRKIEKTAAASVDDMTMATKSER
jgi:hypothetical protein